MDTEQSSFSVDQCLSSLQEVERKSEFDSLKKQYVEVWKHLEIESERAYNLEAKLKLSQQEFEILKTRLAEAVYDNSLLQAALTNAQSKVADLNQINLYRSQTLVPLIEDFDENDQFIYALIESLENSLDQLKNRMEKFVKSVVKQVNIQKKLAEKNKDLTIINEENKRTIEEYKKQVEEMKELPKIQKGKKGTKKNVKENAKKESETATDVRSESDYSIKTRSRAKAMKISSDINSAEPRTPLKPCRKKNRGI